MPTDDAELGQSGSARPADLEAIEQVLALPANERRAAVRYLVARVEAEQRASKPLATLPEGLVLNQLLVKIGDNRPRHSCELAASLGFPRAVVEGELERLAEVGQAVRSGNWWWRPVDPAEPWHGTHNGYLNRKCRCLSCTKANTDHHRVRRARKAAQLAATRGTDA